MMWAAKMSGHADHYELFTPGAGEMAFFADETVPHPSGEHPVSRIVM